MAATTKKAERIAKHGRNLLAIFPNATEQDPVKLCKKLRRLELQANELALRLCNGPAFQTEEEVGEITDAILAKVSRLLGNYEYDDANHVRTTRVPIFLNRDPRGYALKINDRWLHDNCWPIERDWGGYGIIAPEID